MLAGHRALRLGLAGAVAGHRIGRIVLADRPPLAAGEDDVRGQVHEPGARGRGAGRHGGRAGDVHRAGALVVAHPVGGVDDRVRRDGADRAHDGVAVADVQGQRAPAAVGRHAAVHRARHLPAGGHGGARHVAAQVTGQAGDEEPHRQARCQAAKSTRTSPGTPAGALSTQVWPPSSQTTTVSPRSRTTR